MLRFFEVRAFLCALRSYTCSSFIKNDFSKRAISLLNFKHVGESMSYGLGRYTCFPIASSPANFLVMRIASQFNLSARNTRNVVPRTTDHTGGNNPIILLR